MTNLSPGCGEYEKLAERKVVVTVFGRGGLRECDGS
jgi:hypothetical protein